MLWKHANPVRRERGYIEDTLFMANVDSDFSLRVVQRFMLCIGCREMKYGVEFCCISPSILQAGWWASFLIVGVFLVFAQCYINFRVVICLLRVYAQRLFLSFSKHACLTGGFRVIGKKKEVVSLFFCVVCCPYFSLIYLYLSGRLSDQILSCKFPLLSLLVLFFPSFISHCMFILLALTMIL